MEGGTSVPPSFFLLSLDPCLDLGVLSSPMSAAAIDNGAKQQPSIPEWLQWPLPPLGGIERLPTYFGERQIKFRAPYSMPGEYVVKFADNPLPFSSAFPEATFLQATDKPMEVHRMLADVTPLTTDQAGNLNPLLLPAATLKAFLRCVRVSIQDVSKNQLITKNKQLLSDLLDETTGAWEWYDPYTMSRSEGFEISFDFLQFDATALGLPQGVTITGLRLAVTFEGYTIVIAPPTNER